MTPRITPRIALVACLLALPAWFAGCDVDTHGTATGKPKSVGLEPGAGPGQSGSTSTYKVNAGGPGAPDTTPANLGNK